MKANRIENITDDVLHSYLDGDLAADVRLQLEAALEAHEGLRHRLHFLRVLERSVVSELSRTAPPGLEAAVMGRIPEHIQVRPVAQKQSNRALYYFFALLAVFTGIAVHNRGVSSISGESPFMKPVDWIAEQFSLFGDTLSTLASAPLALRMHTSDALLLAAGIIMILILLDMYILRPLSRKN